MKGKKNKWFLEFNKSNLILYGVGLVICIMLIGLYFINKDNPWCVVSCSVGASGLGAILLAFFIEKNNLKINKDIEKKLILNNFKSFKIVLESYIFTFNLLTTKSSKRFDKEISCEKINQEFTMNDLNGMHVEKIGFEFGLSYTPLQEYTFAQKKLIQKMEQILGVVNFNFFKGIESSLLETLEILYKNDNLEHLIQYQYKNKMTEVVQELIEEYSGNPEEDFENGKYNGNLFLPILKLFLNLKRLTIKVNNMKAEFDNLSK